ncbi:hypothetical protein Y032_0006g3157 [Ancylostoma ceylanicum]|uniref:Uncharacterized protein n=1 Tax=Ancylostoma ceylanicum TaxID=53326 RepID=A0A016VQP3_9BILA|nr:hypothetical protein Y032_0006g3157 [Ancylostoma ceylanicum]
MLRIVLLLTLVAMVQGQLLKQCRCSEIEPCTNIGAHTVLECSDQCQRYAGKTGASYPALRKCYQEISGTLNAIVKCVKGRLSNSCARYGNPILVRKFYPEFFKLSMLKEINGVLKRSGVQFSVARFFADDKQYTECRLKCIGDRATSCLKSKNCGLNLPSNDVLIQTLKQCAFSSGMGTDGFRKLCRCTARAGARGLAQVCERIIIT